MHIDVVSLQIILLCVPNVKDFVIRVGILGLIIACLGFVLSIK